MATSKKNEINNGLIDLTKTGPLSYRELQAINNGLPEESLANQELSIRPGNASVLDRAGQIHYKQNPDDFGNSVYDDPLASIYSYENYEDLRGEREPWYVKIGNGLAKGVVLAGTTFLDGTVGLALGAGTAISEGRWDGLWDNDFSRAMQAVNQWSEEAMPNYYTNEEKEPKFSNIFTANFLGDKFIKNLGFSVGAIYSGGVWSKGLTLGGKLAQTIGAVAKSSKAPAIISTALGAGISAVNEGRIEALNNSSDWYEMQKTQLSDMLNQDLGPFDISSDNITNRTILEQELRNMEDRYLSNAGKELVTVGEGKGAKMVDLAYVEYQQNIQKLKDAYLKLQAKKPDYESTLVKMNEDRAKMGNADLLFNLPILMASNIIEFGKYYSNGFKTARKAKNIVGRAGEYTADKTKLGGIIAATKSALSEGTEEISQGAASRMAGDYYQDDVNNFYKAKIDPNAEQETLSWMKSFAQGINQTVNDGNSWEEFFIGTLTGALGIPSFKRKSNGKLGFGIEGGAVNQVRDYNEQMAREQEIATYMNQRVQSPEFLNYYQGLIRHNKYQNDMNDAVDRGDEFDYKNAEHAQMVSDIIMFDNANRLDDLKTLVNSSFDTSDENLDAIVRNTTTNTDGSLSGPFAQYAKLEDGQIVSSFATEEDKKTMIDKLTQSRDEMMNSIDEYAEIKNDIDIKVGERLTDEQLNELTWMRSQLSDWAKRAASVSGEVKSAIGHVIGNLEQFYRFNQDIINYEGQHNAGLTEKYLEADSQNKTFRKAIDILNNVRSQSDESLAATLASNPSFVNGLVDKVTNLDDNAMGQESKDDIISKLNDIVKLGSASKLYTTKLTEYLSNPEKLTEDNTKSTESVAKKEQDKKVSNFRDTLNSATTMKDFRAAVNNAESPEVRDQAIGELAEQGSQLAKDYTETQLYSSEISKALSSLGESEQVISDASKLFQDQYDNSANLEQLANPNSVFVTNENAFDEEGVTAEESADRFINAQYALQRAMSQVNNDMKFRDRFSTEYKQPVTDPNFKGGSDRVATGSDRTDTVPDVNNSSEVNIPQAPVGNITSDMVSTENMQLNREQETPVTLDSKNAESRPYYRPSIPQLHIEASKQGDFRPFKDVVKERESGVNFDAIYDHLENNGAFDYVNNGNLTEGDEVQFVIDPTFEDKVKDESWHTKPTIFMTTPDGQIIGSLDDGGSTSRFTGLAGLQEKIIREYDSADKTKRFVASPKTRVAKVMAGKVAYGNQEQSLSSIPGVTDSGSQPVFGIIKNGVLTTNGKIADDKIVKPVDMANKEGRLYLLIPNGAGKYSPAAVRVKHFNREEFDLEDALISDTPIGRSINKAIDDLSNAQSQGDVAKAMESLVGDIYMQDVMITWNGNGITIGRKLRKPDGTYETVDIKGEQKVREEKIDIPFKPSESTIEEVTHNGISFDPSMEGIEISPDVRKTIKESLTPRDINDIRRDILDTLLRFNLPMQVDARKINNGAYNTRVINSGLTTSNITDTKMRGNWFITDYFDEEGNLQRAIAPASVKPASGRAIETPVGGKEGAITGTQVSDGSNNYYVDLANGVIRNNMGNEVNPSSDVKELLIDLAWANNSFGDNSESAIMIDNKVITPSGKVLDRVSKRYLSDSEAQTVKDSIAGRNKEQARRRAEADRVIGTIYENQKRVDKTRTDSESYWILEEDGEYHPYSRVHTELGNNWVQSPKQKEALDFIQASLSKFVDDPKQYDDYLENLSKKYNINLQDYKGKTDIKSRERVVSIIRDLMARTNSMRALDAGTAIDGVIRQYFTTKDVSKISKPDNLTEQAFLDLLNRLNQVKESIERAGETFLTDNIVLFHKYPDGRRVAGEVDILSVDKEGNFKIYDVKTSKWSFGEFLDGKGRRVNYFENKSATQRISTKDYYTLQLSSYKNLFESQYHLPIKSLGIMPFVLSYTGSNVSAVVGENGIPIAYNPSVNIPLDGAVKNVVLPAEDKGNKHPIFSTLAQVEQRITPTEGDIVGPSAKFVIDGKIMSGNVMPIDTIGGVEVFMARVPNFTSGFERPGEEQRVGNYNYYAVFPNGQTVLVSPNVGVATSIDEVAGKIKAALNGNPTRVASEASKDTLLTQNMPVVEKDTASTILKGQSSSYAQAVAEIQKGEDSSRRRRKLRVNDDPTSKKWDREKELAWLDKVLPQLSRENRIAISEGLIRVSENGPKAWGMFDNGIVTLSDIAAEGTTYHEAFHVVFNLLLDQKEREALYKDAAKMFGTSSNSELEEHMAEGFREYVISRDSRGIGQKLLDFFKRLFDKVTNWKYIRPSLNSYYRMITEGRYVSNSLGNLSTEFNAEDYTTDVNEVNSREVGTTERGTSIAQRVSSRKNTTSWADINDDVKDILLSKGWTEEMFNNISPEEKEVALRCYSF